MGELSRFGMDSCWIWLIIIFFLVSNPCCLSKITEGIKCYFGDFGCGNSIIWVIILFLVFSSGDNLFGNLFDNKHGFGCC